MAQVKIPDNYDEIKEKWGECVIGHYADGSPHYAKEIIFTHIDSVGDVRHFAIEKMNKVAPLRGYDILPIKTDYETFAMIRDNFGIEDHRLYRLKAEHCLTPTLWVTLPERPSNGAQCTAIMVDGAHRYVAAVGRFGWDRIPGYLFPVGDWEEFLITMDPVLSERAANDIIKDNLHGTAHFSGIR